MNEEGRDLYERFVEYYAEYDREELIILRHKLINKWNLIEESARNLVREEFKMELQAIDASLRDIYIQERVKDLRVEVRGEGEA